MNRKMLASVILATLVLDVAWAQPAPPKEPPGPAPRNAEGRVLLSGAGLEDKGLWSPNFPIFKPGGGFNTIAPLESIPFQPWARALSDAREITQFEPHARCKASGAARQFLTPYGVEFVELEDLGRLYIFDVGGPHTFRTVYMDGRSHPTDGLTNNYGHSIGWWEGDTLVIDTVGYNEDFWFERRGLPFTEQLHTLERFTRTDAGTIDYRLTVDDPGAYTAAFEGGFKLRWEEDVELFEYICQQANLADVLMVEDDAGLENPSPVVVP
ncbi:MAG: hypothetical protein RQ899_04145 [Pseudomonadales bacterium]|nr:hypothetical protein [Pseudomonadales bacterium]